MSTWYNKIVNDMSVIADAISYYEKEISEAKFECKIKGSLEKSSAALPGITEHRFNQLQEVEAILEYLNIQQRKIRGALFRKYLEHYNRSLSSRDAEKYVDGDDEVISMAIIINDFSLLRNQYLGIMKGLEQKSFQISSITRLRVAGMEDISIG